MTEREILQELEVFLRKISYLDDNVLPGIREASSTFADHLERMLEKETVVLDQKEDDE